MEMKALLKIVKASIYPIITRTDAVMWSWMWGRRAIGRGKALYVGRGFTVASRTVCSRSLWTFNSFTEIQFTYHTIHPFKVYNSMFFNIFTDMYNHLHSQFSIFSWPQKETLGFFIDYTPKQSLIYFSLLYICPFWILRKNRILWYVTFCNWYML